MDRPRRFVYYRVVYAAMGLEREITTVRATGKHMAVVGFDERGPVCPEGGPLNQKFPSSDDAYLRINWGPSRPPPYLRPGDLLLARTDEALLRGPWYGRGGRHKGSISK